jgi:hypothetical protein
MGFIGLAPSFGLRKQFNGKTYIEAPLPLKQPGSIMQILVGPAAPSGSAKMVSDFLKEQGYPTASRLRGRRPSSRVTAGWSESSL